MTLPRHDPTVPGQPTVSASPLDDADYARFAWARYRRILLWMAVVGVLLVGAALGWLGIARGEVPIHMAIAVSAGVFGTMFLTAVLMGLVFLSSGTGHDDGVDDPFAGEADQ